MVGLRVKERHTDARMHTRVQTQTHTHTHTHTHGPERIHQELGDTGLLFPSMNLHKE